MSSTFDAIVIGGGPAGLSCALVLGRCRRSVIVFDTGEQRNKVSRAMHAFPSRDGEHPRVFLNEVKSELLNYGIRIRKKKIVSVKILKNGFSVLTTNREVFRCKKLLLATGLRDELPPLKGIEKYYGRGVFHCPYCDGWEHRDGSWVVYAANAKAAKEICLRLKTWTQNITLLTAHVKNLSKNDAELLVKNGIKLATAKATEVQGRNGNLQAIEFEDGSRLACDALFFSGRTQQQSRLAENLGCRITKKGNVDFNRLQQTNVSGLFAAGDMARDMNLMLIAAAEGAKAAVVINTELNKEQRKQ